MRRSVEFRGTVRYGVRAGRPTVVVHARRTGLEEPTRVGFVVSKAVGNAVTRNRVRRRLRHLARALLVDAPVGLAVVVRALPEAAFSPSSLPEDFSKAWNRAVTKVSR